MKQPNFKLAMDQARLAGIEFPGAAAWLKQEWRKDWRLAADAQPQLVTTPNSGIPSLLTTFIDPDLLRILTAKNAAAKIYPEERKGTWLDDNVIFPIVEPTGLVSAYGDYENNGNASVNTNFPDRQSFLYQVILNWGQREMERAGLAKIGWAAEVKEAGISVLNKFQNLMYFFGIAGLQNYGMLNDPGLLPAIAPAPKTWGGNSWINSSGAVVASANEIYNDILSLFSLVVAQSSGLIEMEDELILALSPRSQVALATTNSFNVNVEDLLKKNFPKLSVKTAVQFGAVTAQNPQGNPIGETIQMIAPKVEGQQTGMVAFNEKLRGFPIITELSAFKQKMSQGGWGWIGRQPFAVSSMVGV